MESTPADSRSPGGRQVPPDVTGPDLIPTYAGNDPAALERHLESLEDLYHRLGDVCEEVDQAIIATTARLKTARAAARKKRS